MTTSLGQDARARPAGQARRSAAPAFTADVGRRPGPRRLRCVRYVNVQSVPREHYAPAVHVLVWWWQTLVSPARASPVSTSPACRQACCAKNEWPIQASQPARRLFSRQSIHATRVPWACQPSNARVPCATASSARVAFARGAPPTQISLSREILGMWKFKVSGCFWTRRTALFQQPCKLWFGDTPSHQHEALCHGHDARACSGRSC